MKLLTVNGILIFFIIFRATSNDDVDNKNTTEKPTPLSYSERGTTQLCELDYLFIRSLVATLEQIQIVTNATSRTWPTLFTTHAIVKLKSNKTTLRSNKRLTKAFRTKIYDRFDMHRKRRRRNVDFSDLTSIEKEAIGLNNSDKDAWVFPGDSAFDALHDGDININDEQNKSTSDLEKGKTWKPMWDTSPSPISASKLEQVAGETSTYDTPITHQQPPITQKNTNEEFLYEPEKEEEKKTEHVNNLDYGEESKQTKIPCNETDTNFKVLKKVWVKQPGGVWKDIWTDMPLPLAPEHAKWFIKHSEPDIDLKPDHIDETSPPPLKAVQTWFKKEYIANDPSKVTECPGYGWTKIWRKQPDGKWKTEWKQIAATTQAMAKQMNVGDQSPKWTKVWIKQPDGGWKTGWKKVMATQSFEKKSWNQQPFSANNEMKPGDDGPRWTKVWLKQPDGKWKTGWKQIGPTQSYQKKTWNRQPFSANNEMKPDNGGSPGARWTKTWIKQPDGKWKTGWKQVVPTQSVDQPSWNKKSFSGNNEIKPDDAQSPQWTKVWQKQPDGKWKTLWKQVAPTQSVNQQGWNKPSFSGSNDKKPEGDSMPGYTKVWIKQPDGKWKTSWKQVGPSQSVTEQMPMEEENKWTKVWLKQPDGKWKMEWKQVVPTQGVTTQMPNEGLSPSWTKVWIKQPDGKWKTGWKKVVPTQPITKQSWNKQQVPENNEEKHQDGPNPDSHIFWTQLPDGKWGTVWKKPESIPYSRSNQLNPIQELVKRFSLPVPAQRRVSLNWSRILEMRSDRTKIDQFSGLTSINPFMAS